MPRTYFETFNRDDEAETEVTVEYTYYGGSPANYDHPGDPSEVEIVKALTDAGEVQLTDAEDERFTNWILENHEDDEEPDYDD